MDKLKEVSEDLEDRLQALDYVSELSKEEIVSFIEEAQELRDEKDGVSLKPKDRLHKLTITRNKKIFDTDIVTAYLALQNEVSKLELIIKTGKIYSQFNADLSNTFWSIPTIGQEKIPNGNITTDSSIE